MSRWRKFLQPVKDEVDSYVVVDIPKDYNATLKIADCTKTVELLFSWSTPKKKEISQKKIAILKEALDRLESGLEKLGE